MTLPSRGDDNQRCLCRLKSVASRALFGPFSAGMAAPYLSVAQVKMDELISSRCAVLCPEVGWGLASKSARPTHSACRDHDDEDDEDDQRDR